MSAPQSFVEHIQQQMSAAAAAPPATSPGDPKLPDPQQVNGADAQSAADAQPEPTGQAENEQGRKGSGQAQQPGDDKAPIPRERFEKVYGKAKELERHAQTLYNENNELKLRLARLEGSATAMSRKGAADQGSERTDEQILAELLGEDPPDNKRPDDAAKANVSPELQTRLERLEKFEQQARAERADNFLEAELVPALIRDTGLPKKNVLTMLARGMEPQEIVDMFQGQAKPEQPAAPTRPTATPPPGVPKANSNVTAPARAPSRKEWGSWVDTAFKS